MPKVEKHCNQCGHCCRVLVNILPMSPEAVEWANARGYKCIDSSANFLALEIPSVCPQLDGVKCKLQDKKPVTCVQYPNFLKATELEKMGLKRNRIIGHQCGYCSR